MSSNGLATAAERRPAVVGARLGAGRTGEERHVADCAAGLPAVLMGLTLVAWLARLVRAALAAPVLGMPSAVGAVVAVAAVLVAVVAALLMAAVAIAILATIPIAITAVLATVGPIRVVAPLLGGAIAVHCAVSASAVLCTVAAPIARCAVPTTLVALTALGAGALVAALGRLVRCDRGVVAAVLVRDLLAREALDGAQLVALLAVAQRDGDA